MTVKENGNLYRTNQYIHFISKNKEKNEIHGEKLFEIIKDENYHLKFNHYNLDDNENISTPNLAWFLLKKQAMTNRSNTYHLREGDILKLGRISFLIRSLNFAKNENTSDRKSVV